MRELLDAAVNNEVWARKLVTELELAMSNKHDQNNIVAIFDQILTAHTRLVSQYLCYFPATIHIEVTKKED